MLQTMIKKFGKTKNGIIDWTCYIFAANVCMNAITARKCV